MRSLLILFVCGLAMASAATNAVGRQSIESIRAAAADYVRAHLDGPAGHVKVRPAGPDKRLRLASCGKSLDVFLPPGGHINSRTTVGVRCAGPKPWKIYVPVLVSRFGKVVVAARSFRRGDTPSANQLTLATRNLDHLPYGWFSSIGKLQGRHFVRGVREGQVLTPAMLDVNNVVHRGQQVVLMAETGGIQVRMAGRALADAAPDERVRVENLSSHRVVEGVVRSNSIVEVLP